ncbi:hypothetical protein [Euzebya sp.]|uniref:hypothetical protein n=1 Tax=Euzebya sp. TaxID=1971409 RepID=UPI003519CB40
MSFASIHGYVIGIAIIGSWLVVMLLALVLRLVRADADNGWFWRVVSVAQVLLVVQLLAGAVLLIMGRLPSAHAFDNIFHPLYGLVFPGIVLFVGHKWSRDGRMHPLSAFALVGLVNFGLTARAFMVAVVG